jgi:hypothetical protein
MNFLRGFLLLFALATMPLDEKASAIRSRSATQCVLDSGRAGGSRARVVGGRLGSPAVSFQVPPSATNGVSLSQF